MIYRIFVINLLDVVFILYIYCVNLVHFYSVPNVRNYLHHRMSFGLIGSVPILRLHEEPLSSFENRLIKRTFDFFSHSYSSAPCSLSFPDSQRSD